VIALKIFASMKKITKDLPLALCPPTDFWPGHIQYTNLDFQRHINVLADTLGRYRNTRTFLRYLLPPKPDETRSSPFMHKWPNYSCPWTYRRTATWTRILNLSRVVAERRGLGVVRLNL
jgi:hypothetical protein